MLVRAYCKVNGLKADEVLAILNQQYSQRQWVGSSKLSPDEMQSLNNHFDVGDRLPILPTATEAEQPAVEDMRSPIEEEVLTPDSESPAGQIQTAPQQLPQAQQSPSELTQAIQYLLTQQQSRLYSSELKTESAALDGASDAYREFMAYQSGYSGTAQGLQQLAQTLDELKYKASTDGFGQTQKDFLSSLRHNSERSRAANTQHTQQVQSTQTQTANSITQMQNAVLEATTKLKTGFSNS